MGARCRAIVLAGKVRKQQTKMKKKGKISQNRYIVDMNINEDIGEVFRKRYNHPGAL